MRIDFHAHILPGMDHGCENVAMSLEQLNLASDQQIDMIIATSHFYPHIESARDFLCRRRAAYQSLKEAMVGLNPSIKLGAEVLICNRLDKMEEIKELCIEDSNVLLIEMPMKKYWDQNLIDTLLRLRDAQGLDVIIAHGERYPEREMEKLLGRGFQIQLNVSSTARLFLSSFVKKSIERNTVAALGSDIHGLNNSYKDFTRSMNKLGDRGERIMEKTRILVLGK